MLEKLLKKLLALLDLEKTGRNLMIDFYLKLGEMAEKMREILLFEGKDFTAWCEAHIPRTREEIWLWRKAWEFKEDAKRCGSLKQFREWLNRRSRDAHMAMRDKLFDEYSQYQGDNLANWRVEDAPEGTEKFTWKDAIVKMNKRRKNRPKDLTKVDLVWGDPPWQLPKHKHLYKWLAGFADEFLADGGYLCVQCETMLPDLIAVTDIFKPFKRLSPLYQLNIVYPCFWVNICTTEYLNIYHRPVLVYSKGEEHKPPGKIHSVKTVSNHRASKDLYNMQQPLDACKAFMTALTHPLALIADPFAGVGTLGVACKQTARYYLGTELLPEVARAARRNILEAKGNKILAG